MLQSKYTSTIIHSISKCRDESNCMLRDFEMNEISVTVVDLNVTMVSFFNTLVLMGVLTKTSKLYEQSSKISIFLVMGYFVIK